MKSDLGLGRFGLGKMVVPPGVIGGVLGIGASPDDMANRPPWGTGRGSDRPTSLPSDMVIVIWCGGSWGGGEAHCGVRREAACDAIPAGHVPERQVALPLRGEQTYCAHDYRKCTSLLF